MGDSGGGRRGRGHEEKELGLEFWVPTIACTAIIAFALCHLVHPEAYRSKVLKFTTGPAIDIGFLPLASAVMRLLGTPRGVHRIGYVGIQSFEATGTPAW